MPAAFLFFSVVMPFLSSSSVKGNTSEESSSLIGDNLGHLDFVGISPRPLTSSWCATWLAVTRQGGFEAVGSLEIFLIVCHAFRLLPVRSVDVIISSHLLLFSAVILLISSLPVSRGMLSKGLLMYCFLYASYRLFDSSQTRNVVASTPPWYMFPQCHMYGFNKPLVVLWSRVNFINKNISVCFVSTPVFRPQVKSSSECSRSR